MQNQSQDASPVMEMLPAKSYRDLKRNVESSPCIHLTVDCVIFGFDENELKVLLIRSDVDIYEGRYSLLGDFTAENEVLEDAAIRVLRERTGMENVFLEQVKTFSRPNRNPGGRVITVAFCSLLNIHHHKIKKMDNELNWHPVKSIQQMAFDHKEILDFCYHWLQRKIQQHPLGFNLLREKFSLRELQNLYEAILDKKMDRRNFRKKFFSMDLLIDTGEFERNVPHRPGKLYRFDFGKYNLRKKKWFGIDF